jgi:hypothetical protein
VRKPDVLGDAGQAWEVPKERMASFAAVHPDKVDPLAVLGTVGAWYLNGRGFHPFWSWWMIDVVDLERRGDQPEPQRHYPDAEYELIVLSLDPAGGVPPLNGEGGADYLTPPDLTLQFHGLTREQARKIGVFFVEACCAGNTSPDSDWRRQNRKALTDLVRNYYVGRYGGPSRSFMPEVDERGVFTGAEETVSWVSV